MSSHRLGCAASSCGPQTGITPESAVVKVIGNHRRDRDEIWERVVLRAPKDVWRIVADFDVAGRCEQPLPGGDDAHVARCEVLGFPVLDWSGALRRAEIVNLKRRAHPDKRQASLLVAVL